MAKKKYQSCAQRNNTELDYHNDQNNGDQPSAKEDTQSIWIILQVIVATLAAATCKATAQVCSEQEFSS